MSVRRALALGTLAAALLASSASASGPAPRELAVAGVDTSDLPLVRVTVTAGPATRGRFLVREDGRAVPGVTVERASNGSAVALALDVSQSMRGRPLASALAAARSFVTHVSARDRVALFTFGHGVETVRPLTSSIDDLEADLRAVEVDQVQGTALNDGIATALGELTSDRTAGRRVLVVLADGDDNGSHARAAAVERAAREAGVTVYTVAVRSRDYRPGFLRRLAAATGGTHHETTADGLVDVYRGIASELSRAYTLSWLAQSPSPGRIDVRRGSRLATATIPGGGPVAPTPPGEPPISHAAWAPFALAAAVAALLLIGLSAVFRWRPRRTVGEHLSSYTARHESDLRSAPRESFLRHIAAGTESLLGDLNVWKRTGALIQRANLRIKTAELFYIGLGSGLALLVLTRLVGLSPIVSAVLAAVAFLAPLLVVRRKAAKRQKAFEEQLPDALVTMASSLKAGHSFNQALETIVTDGSDPMATELGRAASEVRLGRAPDEALEQIAQRMRSESFGFVVTTVNIQRQTGGSLAEILDSVSETVRGRQQFRRKVKALTSTGRASAYVLVALPFFMALGMTAVNRSFLEPLYTTPVGKVMVAGALVSMSLGWVVIKKIVNFRV